MVLLDTCALIWWTLDPDKLSEAAACACNDIADTGGIISSISIWEIGIKVKKGSIDIGIGLEEYISRLKRLDSLSIIPVDENISGWRISYSIGLTKTLPTGQSWQPQN